MKHVEPQEVHPVQMVNANIAKEIAAEKEGCQCMRYT